MNPNPILRVLSTFQRHRVRALLIGGQACIVYGAAEFSRDSDFVILCTSGNLRRVRAALADLQAEPVYLPPLRLVFLRRGHACHFRCRAPDVSGLRVDLLARLRGCDEFPALWRRRKTVRLSRGESIEVLGLRDLVESKKTQRDGDWLMLRRLVDNDIFLHRTRPRRGQVGWWLRECRSVETLVTLARDHPGQAKRCATVRPSLNHAIAGDPLALEDAIRQEERVERAKDRAYWGPLKQELERMRRRRRLSGRPR